MKSGCLSCCVCRHLIDPPRLRCLRRCSLRLYRHWFPHDHHLLLLLSVDEFCDCFVCRFAYGHYLGLEKRFTQMANAHFWQIAFQVEVVTTTAKYAPQCTFILAIHLVTFPVSMKIEGTIFLFLCLHCVS